MRWEHWSYTIPLRLKSLFRRNQAERELAEELQFHLERKIEELIAIGLSPEEARLAALRSMDGVEQQKELCRDARRVGFLEDLAQDVRFGIRILRRSPVFSIVAIATVALGIGANTALFSVVNGVLLSPLPYPEPERLVTLHESKPNFDTGSIPFPNFLDWQKDNHTFSAMAISRRYSFAMTGPWKAEQVSGDFVTSDFFNILGIKPILGRTFQPGEDRVGAAPVAMISEGLWMRRFGRSTDVLNRAITLDGKSYSIIGVVPASLKLSARGFRTGDAYLPVGQWSNSLLLDRGAGLGFHGFGRLKPGVTISHARADMEQVSRNLSASYPEKNRGIGATIVPFKSEIVGSVRSILLLLMGAVGFVLLIACVNVGNLLLVRSSTRRREFALRNALGAGRSRLTRQLLTESILLTLVGGALGLLLAYWGTRVALSLLPINLPRVSEVRMDGHVLTFTVLISVLAGVLAGVAPTLRSARANLRESIQDGGRSTGGMGHGTHRFFVIAEIAMALILLIGAGLMTRSLVRLWNVDPGFDPHNVLTFGLSFPPSVANADPDRIRSEFREVTERLASLPGIQATSVAWGAFPLLGDDEWRLWLDGQSKPATQDDMIMALDYVVQPGYLETMRVPLRRGRFFTEQDNEKAPLVAVIDEVFAERYFPRQDPIGHFIYTERDPRPIQIVGVAGHVKQWGLDTDDTELRTQLYIPFMQLTDSEMKQSGTGIGVAVRYQGEKAAIVAAIEHASEQVSAEQVISSPQTMDEVIASTFATRNFTVILLGTFAGLALILALIGIYGVLSFVVGQRTQEIGVRMALGASGGEVVRLILKHGARMAIAGILIGVVAALFLTRLMQSMLYGVSSTDPFTFAAVAVALGLIALLAAFIPARRAARVDPMVALRCE